MPAWSDYTRDKPVVDFIDYCFRGAAQVVFMNNPISGNTKEISWIHFLHRNLHRCCVICNVSLGRNMWTFRISFIDSFCAYSAAQYECYTWWSIWIQWNPCRTGQNSFSPSFDMEALATFMDKPWSYFTAIAVVINGMFSTVSSVFTNY